MCASEPDDVLISQTLSGDRAQFDALTGRYHAQLKCFLSAAVGDADEAESLTQETLTRAWAQLGEFRRELPFRAWLFGIARNLVRNHFRSLRRHARVLAPDQLVELAGARGRSQSVLSTIARREALDRLRAGIAKLPEPFRDAFTQHFVEGLDYNEISRRTGVAPGTLRVRAHRARSLLRGDLGTVVDTWLRQSSASSKEP